MKKNLLSLLFLSLIALSSAFAQSRKITGTVSGADDGLSLPGVSVKVQGTSTGTTTNAQGEFSITVTNGAKALVFSYIGYTGKTVPISGAVMNVKLTADNKNLTEVVVVGYGSGVSVSNTPGLVSTVTSKDFENKPVANLFDALQGKVAGLTVLSSSGEPSSTPSLSLNGVGSLGASSTPLIVIDGIPVDPGTILSLNPDDYDQIAVLKDAASTSIYGSRAANGVIELTSKKGSANRPASITVTSQYGINQIANPEYFNNFFNTAQFAAFEVATGIQTQASVNTILATYGNADTKWYKTYFKNNTGTYNENLAISGGSGKTTYYVSGAYFREDGLAYRSLYNRYTFRSNVASEVTSWAKFGVNLSMGYDERQANPYGSNNLNRGLSVLAQPWYSPTGPDGQNYQFIPGLGLYHPQYLANTHPDNQNNSQFDPAAYLQLTPIKGLTIKTQMGMDDFDFRESVQILPSYIGSLNNGSDNELFTRGISKTFTNTAEYRFTLASVHNITALVGQEYTDGTTLAFNGSDTGQNDDRLLSLTSGTTAKTVNSSSSEYSYKSLFARLNYDFNNRYYIQGTVRQDQSSRFGANEKTAIFYSVGVTWKAKQESFLKDISWLTDANVKASTGTTGNSSIGNYLSLATVSNNVYNGQTGYGINNAGNPDLTWEKQQLTTIDFNVSIFDRINLDASFYVKTTTAMLIAVPFAYTSGFATVTTNTGSLQNKGVDINFSFEAIDRHNSHNAYITPNLVLGLNKDKIVALFNGLNYYTPANTGILWAIGKPVSYIEPLFAGIDPASGQALWYNPDPNPNNVVNKTTTAGVTNNFNATLQQNIGVNRNPWGVGSFGLDAGYEGFSLSAMFTFVTGKYITNNDQYFSQNPNQFTGYNQEVNVLDYWKKPGDITTFPKYGVQFTQFDSRLIQDASFMRLKNLTLGYSIPKRVLARTKAVKSVKVFFIGRDLMTFTKYKGIDPEVDSNIGLGNDPNTKQYSLGLTVGF